MHALTKWEWISLPNSFFHLCRKFFQAALFCNIHKLLSVSSQQNLNKFSCVGSCSMFGFGFRFFVSFICFGFFPYCSVISLFAMQSCWSTRVESVVLHFSFHISHICLYPSIIVPFPFVFFFCCRLCVLRAVGSFRLLHYLHFHWNISVLCAKFIHPNRERYRLSRINESK